ncbi:putative tetratricopeptide-like helical domain superfamily [Helianthus debilis subsp. tardiflorus]
MEWANVRRHNAMISGFCRKGLLREAKNLFLKMGERGCPPDNVSYRVLLHGYLKNQHFDDVEILLQQMDRSSYSLDASTLSLLKDRVTAGSLDRSLLKLIPKELMDSFTGREMKIVSMKCVPNSNWSSCVWSLGIFYLMCLKPLRICSRLPVYRYDYMH